MAIAKMRDLLRNPKPVFDGLESDGEPVLITRNGSPVAMLTKVEPSKAVSAVMSALPEFVDRRKRAELSRSEGRTVSSQEILARLASEPATAEDQGSGHEEGRETGSGAVEAQGQEAALEAILEEVTVFFGADAAREMADTVSEQVIRASEPVVQVVAATGPGSADVEDGEVEERVYELSGELFRRFLPGVYCSQLVGLIPELLPELHSGPTTPEQMHRSLCQHVLDDVTMRVQEFNELAAQRTPAGAGLSLPLYEYLVLTFGQFSEPGNSIRPLTSRESLRSRPHPARG
jgi:antitoxin (DNA-binding transcriptional repressor) of toxin-antitoxin stability system